MEHFARHKDECQKCKEMIISGQWHEDEVKNRDRDTIAKDDYTCKHVGCTWRSTASTKASRKYSILTHEQGYRCHKKHHMTQVSNFWVCASRILMRYKGHECARCIELLGDGTWVKHPDGTISSMANKKNSTGRKLRRKAKVAKAGDSKRSPGNGKKTSPSKRKRNPNKSIKEAL